MIGEEKAVVLKESCNKSYEFICDTRKTQTLKIFLGALSWRVTLDHDIMCCGMHEEEGKGGMV